MANSLKSISSLMKYILKSFLGLMAPRVCLVCEDNLEIIPSNDSFICQRCLDSIPIAPPPEQIINRFYRNFSKDIVKISKAACLIDLKEDSEYMNIIYALKYSKFPDIGKEFGTYLGRILKMYGMTDYDAIIPVPIHHARRRERGFNQSESIACGIADELGLPIENMLLKRIKYTSSQTLLDRNSRKYNVSKVFQVSESSIGLQDKKYLLCDDVLTTGSTLIYCAEVMHNAGANRIDAATIAWA